MVNNVYQWLIITTHCLTIINQLDQNSMDFEADLGLGDLGLAYGRRRRPTSSPVVLGFWAQKKPCQTYDLLGCAAPLVRVDIYTPGASKTQKIVGPVKKTSFFEKKRFFGKEPIFWFLLDLHKIVRIGWTCIKFLLITWHVAIYIILTTCEICQTERAIETEASVVRHDARFLHRLQLPPMLRTFPSAGLEVVKKSQWTWHFKSQLFRYKPSKLTIAPVICVAFFLSGSGNYRFDLAKPQAEP